MLDIGAGTGHVAAILRNSERDVVACDILNLLMLPLPYVIADGARLPFLDESFDAATLITVMHHVPKPLHARVLIGSITRAQASGKLVVMEDTFTGISNTTQRCSRQRDECRVRRSSARKPHADGVG